MSKKILALIVASLLAVALLASCSGDSGSSTGGDASTSASTGGSSGSVDTSNTEFEFNVNYTNPEQAGFRLTEYCDKITEQSNGRIVFNHYYASSLMSIPEVPKGLQDGIADISHLPLNNYQQQFPLNAQILAVPFLGIPSVQAAADIYNTLYEEFPELKTELEDQGMTYLATAPFAPYHLMFNKEANVRAPEDLSGLKIIVSSTELSEMFTAYGGVPIQQPPTEFFASLEKGVADGVVNHFPAGLAFGVIPDLSKQSTVFGSDDLSTGLIYNYAHTVIRTASLERLPDDLQQLFWDNLDEYAAAEIEQVMAMGQNAIDANASAGNEVINLSNDEVKVWRDAAEPYREATIATLEGTTPVARDIYNRALELVADAA